MASTNCCVLRLVREDREAIPDGELGRVLGRRAGDDLEGGDAIADLLFDVGKLRWSSRRSPLRRRRGDEHAEHVGLLRPCGLAS